MLIILLVKRIIAKKLGLAKPCGDTWNGAGVWLIFS